MTTTLHLVRSGATLPPGVLAEGDRVVYLEEAIDYDQLVALIFAADRVITW